MMNYLIAYNKTTLQIDDYAGNSVISPSDDDVHCDPATHALVRAENPHCVIDRDHKVVLDGGELVDTEYSLNPVQAQPDPAQERQESARRDLDDADFDAAKKSIEAAQTIDDLKVTLALLVELMGRLAEAMGLEPVMPVEVGP